MTERVDIANLALTWLGEKEITSLDDDLQRARIMKINYIPARDYVLEAHEWSFAMKRWIPNKKTETPVFGASNLFPIPSDILRVTGVWDNDNPDRPDITSRIDSKEQADWIIEGREILCNEEVIYCKGIKRIKEEGIFSPMFVHAFAAQLAALCAMPITASAEIQSNMAGLYEVKIQEAVSRDGLQGRSRRIRSRTLQKVR